MMQTFMQTFTIELCLIYCFPLQKSGDVKYQNSQSGDQWGDHFNEPSRADQIVLHLENQIGGVGNVDINSVNVLPNSVLQTDLIRSNRDHAMQTHIEDQFDSSKVNGSLNAIHGGHAVSDNSGVSQIMSPSITLFTPTRYIRYKCGLYTCGWL